MFYIFINFNHTWIGSCILKVGIFNNNLCGGGLMDIKFAFVKAEGSHALQEYVRSELRKRILQEYVRSVLKRRIPEAYIKPVDLLLTFSVTDDQHTATCYLKSANGMVVQVSQTSPDLYKAIDLMISRLSLQLRRQKSRIPDFKIKTRPRSTVAPYSRNDVFKDIYDDYRV